jgi:RNA polymerase subunit RPABC4/transcription elongation factor Spt4
MAKCKNCDYPYASEKRCPNCGSDNPSGKSSGGVILVIIIIIIIAALSQK